MDKGDALYAVYASFLELLAYMSVRFIDSPLGYGCSQPCLKGTVMDLSLPEVNSFVLRNEHRIFLGDAECLVPCVDVRECTVYTPFTE